MQIGKKMFIYIIFLIIKVKKFSSILFSYSSKFYTPNNKPNHANIINESSKLEKITLNNNIVPIMPYKIIQICRVMYSKFK